MRPLFLEFPEDENTWTVGDAYLFGPDVLVAPVTDDGRDLARGLPARRAPSGPTTGAGDRYAGGQAVDVDAPLERIPLFLRDGARPW